MKSDAPPPWTPPTKKRKTSSSRSSQSTGAPGEKKEGKKSQHVDRILALKEKIRKEFAQTDFEFWVDSKEPPYIRGYIEEWGTFVRSYALECGDYMLIWKDPVKKERKAVWIFERKSDLDLNSAIGTSRYRTQKHNLGLFCYTTCMDTSRVIYLYEKSVVNPKYRKPEQNIRGARVNSFVRDRFSAWWTTSASETILVLGDFLLKTKEFLQYHLPELACQRSLEEVKLFANDMWIVQNLDHVDVNPPKCTCHELNFVPRPLLSFEQRAKDTKTLYFPKKKKNLSDKERWTRQICEWPSIGPQKAKIIAENFSSFNTLKEFVEKGPKEEAINKLSSLSCGKRPLGPRVAEILYNEVRK